MDRELRFNPDTVSSLAERIEASLKKAKNGKSEKLRSNNKQKANSTENKPGIDSKVKGKGPIAKDRPETGVTPQKVKEKDAGRIKTDLEKVKIGSEKLKTGSETRGKKRSSDGRLKQSSNGGTHTNGVATVGDSHTDVPGEPSNLEQDILALGGSKDDLDLIEGDASDSEIDGDAFPSKPTAYKGLQKDLLRFVQELGIKEVPREADEVSESEARENDSDLRTAENKASETAMDTSSLPKPRQVKAMPVYEVEPSAEWYSTVLPALSIPHAESGNLSKDLTIRIHEYAKSLLDIENERYASQSTSANSTQQFYSTIMSSGTLSDKISALTLSIQESPLHNMKTLDALVGLARKRSRGQAVEVLGALKDMFGLGSLLPPDRKLRNFVNQPDLSIFSNKIHWKASDSLPPTLTKSHLILWAFEDWLKGIYFEILKILEIWSNDEVVFARGKAVDYICQLLKEKPEQEANLLRLLVNKLGDNDKKIASKTSYHILQLETAHPLMKPIIVSAIESDLLFRPGQSLHAQYYAAITLNQTVLSGKEEDLAKKLLDIYFALFARLLAKPDPKAKVEAENAIRINQKGEIQGGGGPAGKAARRKAAQKEKSTTVEEDLREKMLSSVLTGVNRAVPYTNTADEPFEKHLNTLFRVTHSSNFNTSIQALMLIQQINSSHQASADRYYRTLYESLLDPRLLTSSKQALYLNLLFKSLRSDLNVKRVKAFAKRLLQVASMHQPSFACGAMYMLRELEAVFASFSTFVDDPEADNSDEEEAFHDVQENEVNETTEYVHPDRRPSEKAPVQAYDPRKRDPEHSNADRSSLWEMVPASIHYHPSVSLFATTLLSHRPLPPKPDMASHTLIHFLDRFVYRNPKATVSARGASIMQPMSSFTNDKTLLSSASSLKARNDQPVNSDAFWRLDKNQVGADEVFFHKYFSVIGKSRDKAKAKRDKKKQKNQEDDEEGSGGEDEEEIWKALVESRPEIEGDESDEDLEMEDLEDLDEEMQSSVMEDEESQQSADDGGDGVRLDDDGIPDFAEDDDDESLLGSDDDVPTNLQPAFEKEVQRTERKSSERNRERKEKRMKLKHLPTFASVEDYEQMLGGDEEGG
ncbi:MAG: hypothetical protein Q9168_005403 [Polycauliona sp. 1 TL-2023]